MVDVNDYCGFTEKLLKFTSIDNLSLKNCELKVKNALDTLSQLKTLKFKGSNFRGEDWVYFNTLKALQTLKEMLNPSISNLEFLSMGFYDKNLEDYLDFFISGFPRLRTVHLWLTDGIITMG
jgi:hypothetical protein